MGEILSWPIDVSIDPMITGLDYFESNNNRYILGTALNDFICRFNLDSVGETQFCKLQEKGPNRIDPQRTSPIDSMEFFIWSYDVKSIYRMNMSGKILEMFPFGKNRDDIWRPYSGWGNTIFKDDKGRFVVPQQYMGSVQENTKQTLLDFRQIVLYDPVSSTYEKVGFEIPFLNDPESCRTSRWHYIKGEAGYLFSYAACHQLFYTEDLKTFKELNCPSKNMPPVCGHQSDSQNYAKYAKKQVEEGTYEAVIYNKYKKQYYRLYKMGEEPNEEKGYNDQQRYPKNFGLQVFDNKLNLIADKQLPENRISRWGHVVLPDGLYLALNNPYCDDYDVSKFQIQKVILPE